LSELSDVPNAKGIITKLLSDGAQLGIHIIAATRQRIRRNILSEEMKKAFQGRISFRQETSIDSKSLLETPDATNLFAVGDGLFLDTTSSTLSRFSSPCIDLNMKKFLFQFISSQPSCSETYMLDVSNKISTTLSADVPVDSATDDLIPQAVEILLHSEKCNEAAIQKALGYSFNTAHRILLRLDELGITKKNGNVRTLQLNDISQIESYLQ
jgi:S-DNA-T family DNA segregation ATPase FtsK/SpoIIIE